MVQSNAGKITAKDETVSQVLKWTPWLAFVLVSIPLPVVFLVLFLTAAATDSAAVFLLLSVLSLGLGALLGLLIVIILYFYRKRWLRRLRDRLAADGITANEVAWFSGELTSAERKALKEIQAQNRLLADAYLETLASRLTATRIRSRANKELLRVERRINQARQLSGVNTEQLVNDLMSDRERYAHLKSEASSRLAEAKARLQTIEAAASRSLNETETDQMLRRLSAAQEQLPLVMEMAKLEEDALRESRLEIEQGAKESLVE
jgi:hypothetical protein